LNRARSPDRAAALPAPSRAPRQRQAPRLIDLSHRIHAHPEVGYEETLASRWVAEYLSAAGFSVELGVCGLPTAFAATFGAGPLHVGICAEYDSLPGIGHACGHNIIAASAVGAATALAAVSGDAGVTVHVLGTPAEEVGDAGGKILMLERGAFDGIHAAMMIHPAPYDVATPNLIAASTFDVYYMGKAAHAAAFPELGVNAADAFTVAQTAIGLLRQHIRGSDPDRLWNAPPPQRTWATSRARSLPFTRSSASTRFRR
jgi:amidohydrolase